jgi:glycerol dehydrogenase-like iron-containing ADH family enzyme
MARIWALCLLATLAAQRDCLTNPSPGPPESARQISSTCSQNFCATVACIVSNMDRKLGVCGGKLIDIAYIVSVRFAERIATD